MDPSPKTKRQEISEILLAEVSARLRGSETERCSNFEGSEWILLKAVSEHRLKLLAKHMKSSNISIPKSSAIAHFAVKVHELVSITSIAPQYPMLFRRNI